MSFRKNEEQLKKLNAIAEACPIHELLKGSLEINTHISF